MGLKYAGTEHVNLSEILTIEPTFLCHTSCLSGLSKCSLCILCWIVRYSLSNYHVQNMIYLSIEAAVSSRWNVLSSTRVINTTFGFVSQFCFYFIVQARASVLKLVSIQLKYFSLHNRLLFSSYISCILFYLHYMSTWFTEMFVRLHQPGFETLRYYW